VYGSSGKFKTQIEQGAPFDLFFSADIAFPRDLLKAGLRWRSSSLRDRPARAVEQDDRCEHAEGCDLTRADIRKIAIANPQHAPYGKRAEEALRASGVWEKVERKLVFGENIAQTRSSRNPATRRLDDCIVVGARAG
jgi:molybdate transport system substrate-binding protein